MATSSIFRSVTAKNARQCHRLVSALERAQNAKTKSIQMSKAVHEMSPEQMKQFFSRTAK